MRRKAVSFRDKFWELMEESVIVQSLVTLAVIFTICTLLILPVVLRRMPDGSLTVVDIPKEVWATTGGILGYWFGTKGNLSRRRELEVQARLIDRMISIQQSANAVQKSTPPL